MARSRILDLVCLIVSCKFPSFSSMHSINENHFATSLAIRLCSSLGGIGITNSRIVAIDKLACAVDLDMFVTPSCPNELMKKDRAYSIFICSSNGSILVENIAQMVPPYRSVGTARSGSVVPLISV